MRLKVLAAASARLVALHQVLEPGQARPGPTVCQDVALNKLLNDIFHLKRDILEAK